MSESIRANIDWIMTAPVNLLYGWFLAWADFCCQGANGWLLLLVGCLAILLVQLFRKARWSRWETALLQASARGMALASSPEAMLSLLFQSLFQVTPALRWRRLSARPARHDDPSGGKNSGLGRSRGCHAEPKELSPGPAVC